MVLVVDAQEALHPVFLVERPHRFPVAVLKLAEGLIHLAVEGIEVMVAGIACIPRERTRGLPYPVIRVNRTAQGIVLIKLSDRSTEDDAVPILLVPVL